MALPRALSILVLGIAVLGGAAGCRDRYSVRHAAVPNPLAHVRTFAVDPLTFDVRVDGKAEADWLAKAPDESRMQWPAGKTAMTASFQRGLSTDAQAAGLSIEQGPAKTGTYRIRAIVRHVETGHFDGPTSADTLVEIDVEIVSDGGVVVDAITSSATVPATALNLDMVDRLRDAAKDVGGNVARYLRDRTGT